MPPIYLFFHLAKTGGTTFVGNLYNHMTFDTDFVDLGPEGNNFRAAHNKPPLEQRTPEELDRVSIVVGHLVYWESQDIFPNREQRRIIFLREPVSRVLSHYTFNNSRDPENFTDWYKHWHKNQMQAYLFDHLRVATLKETLERLATFWHIGFKENLDSSLKTLFTELGLPLEYENRRVSGEREKVAELGYDRDVQLHKTYTPTAEELEQIKYDHQIDTWLYEILLNNTHDFRFTLPKNLEIPDF